MEKNETANETFQTGVNSLILLWLGDCPLESLVLYTLKENIGDPNE